MSSSVSGSADKRDLRKGQIEIDLVLKCVRNELKCTRRIFHKHSAALSLIICTRSFSQPFQHFPSDAEHD